MVVHWTVHAQTVRAIAMCMADIAARTARMQGIVVAIDLLPYTSA